MFNMILASITDANMEAIIKPIVELMSVLVPALLTLVGSVGAVYCIILGVKYSKAEDPQEHDKAKNALKNAIIGFVLIFVLLVMLNVGTSIFKSYYLNSLSS